MPLVKVDLLKRPLGRREGRDRHLALAWSAHEESLGG